MTKINLNDEIKNLITYTNKFGDYDDKKRMLEIIEVFPRKERDKIAKDCGIVGYSNSYMADCE